MKEGAEQQRQTWLSVSPFIHHHLKRGTKQLGSVCWGCPFNPLTAVVYKRVTCVFQLVSVNSREAWFGWMKRGSQFFTLYRSIYYFLVASETKCLLYRILGVGDGKKKKPKQNKRKIKKRESETKKVVVPNTMMPTRPHHRHLVEVQVLVDHRNNGRMETCRIRSEGFGVFRKNGIRRTFWWGFVLER